MNAMLDDRPAVKSVVNHLVDISGRGIWVRRRNFQECIRENNFTVQDTDMSITQLKKSLNWLIWNECVTKIRYEVTHIDGGELKLTRLQAEERMDYYSSLSQHWEFCPRKKLWELTKSDSKDKVSYFAS